MEWRGPVARPRAVLQTVCLPRAVVNSSSLGRTLGGVVLKEVGNALGRLYGASHPLAVAGGQIANPKYGGTTDGVARKTICFGSLFFFGFVLWGLGVCVCVCVCVCCCCGRQECGVCVECVCGECVGCWCKEFLPFPSGLVWTHFPHIRFLLVMAGCYTTGTCHIPRTASAGNHRGGPSAEVPTRGGGRSEGRGVRCWAAATLTCPRTTHSTQLTAHSSQLTAHSSQRACTHTHTGSQGHTVGTLGGLALSSASTHSSGPPNDAHHGRSALHQRRQAASRSSPWWTPPPSG